jgi:hypothetical protein
MTLRPRRVGPLRSDGSVTLGVPELMARGAASAVTSCGLRADAPPP